MLHFLGLIICHLVAVGFCQNEIQDCEPLHCPEYCNLTYRFGCPHNCRCSEAPICYDIECPEGPPQCIIITQHNGCQTCACGYSLRRIRDDHRRMFIFRRITSADIDFFVRTRNSLERDKLNGTNATMDDSSSERSTSAQRGFEGSDGDNSLGDKGLYSFERGAEASDEEDEDDGIQEDFLSLVGHGLNLSSASRNSSATLTAKPPLTTEAPQVFTYKESDLFPSLPLEIEETTEAKTQTPLSTTTTQLEFAGITRRIDNLPQTTFTTSESASFSSTPQSTRPMIVRLGRTGSKSAESKENLDFGPARPLILPPTRVPPPADVAIIRFGKLAAGSSEGSANPAIQNRLNSYERLGVSRSEESSLEGTGRITVRPSPVVFLNEPGSRFDNFESRPSSTEDLKNDENSEKGIRISPILAPPVFLPRPTRPPRDSFSDFRPFKPGTNQPRSTLVTVSPFRAFATKRPVQPANQPPISRLGPRLCSRSDIEQVENVFFPLFRAVFRYQLNGHKEQPIPYHYGAHKFFVLCSIFHDGYARYTELMGKCLPQDFRISETVKTFSFLCNSTATPRIFRHLDCLTAMSLRENCYIHPPAHQQICMTMYQRVQCRERLAKLGCGKDAWHAEVDMLKNQLDTTAPDCVVPLLHKL